MPLARLRQRSNILPIIEIEPEFLFVSTLLVHVERLPEVRVLAKQSWAMSDSFEAVFEFSGHRFVIALLFGSITVSACDSTTPVVTLQRLVAHIENYRTVWPTQWLWAIVRYFFLPYTNELQRA
ncbi:MAG TPA: hypothetical protein VET48_07420 [Steroidobacteraceae bacterium]|nr:hypothetical protein [Steroidobacteraceae bacterium]